MEWESRVFRFIGFRVCFRVGCGCELSRFGSWFYWGKDRVRRGWFFCVSSLLVSTDGKFNY